MFGSDFVETVFESTMMEVVTAPPKISLQEKNRLRALGKDQGGKAPAAWIVLDNESNEEAVGTGSATGECFATIAADAADAKDAPSGRESYVRELQKLMDIDIYGGCMGNTVWPVHEDTQSKFESQTRRLKSFFFSFNVCIIFSPFLCFFVKKRAMVRRRDYAAV